jgi:putative ABC transport system substrate-binding protein
MSSSRYRIEGINMMSNNALHHPKHEIARRSILIGTSASLLCAPAIPARAQQRKAMPRVGVLWHAANAKQEGDYLVALTRAFHDLGYFEGKNIELDHRFPAEQPERFRALAQELAESKVDVIVAVTGLGAREAKRATGTIPVVVVLDPDPVGNGLAESLGHPGGNVTGLSLMTIDLSGKRLALFKEIVPKLARVAVVLDPRDQLAKGFAPHRPAGGAAFVGLCPGRSEAGTVLLRLSGIFAGQPVGSSEVSGSRGRRARNGTCARLGNRCRDSGPSDLKTVTAGRRRHIDNWRRMRIARDLLK